MIELGEHKFTVGRLRIPVKLIGEGSRIFLYFGYNKDLINEVKNMEGAKYHGYDEKNPRKIWSIPNSSRNEFQINFLRGLNPYARYDKILPLESFPDRFNVFENKKFTIKKHQNVMAWHQFIRHYSIISGEMGTGKTLANLLAAERALESIEKTGQFWYVAPRAGVMAVQRDHFGWGSKIPWIYMTYEEMVKRVKDWTSGTKAPFFITFDESSKIKNPTAARSIAAKHLADSVRQDWGDSGFVVEMSGTPAPRSPADWYWQAEVACPGFLKEGDIYKFKNRLGVIVQKESSVSGGSYPELVTWRDNSKKCQLCGQFKEHENHHPELCAGTDVHEFMESKNEVQLLYERLKGLVVVFFKKDCLDLPEKTYRIIEIKPSSSIVRAASTIVRAAKTTIEGLTRLRELSDGFQYIDIPKGTKQCPRCCGNKKSLEYQEVEGTCPTCKDGIPTPENWIAENEFDKPICPNHLPERVQIEVECPNCGGTGEVQAYERIAKEIPGPKDQILVDILDEHDEIGRLVVFAGFTASIDRCIRICHKEQWHTIRVDQGKWLVQSPNGDIIKDIDPLSMFQTMKDQYPKVAYVAHPKSGGISVTLTASPTALYFSNDFNGEDRMQSEDRIHRMGLDTNRGATIIDIIHLPSDQKVLDNLKKKKNLQSMSLGDFVNELSEDRKV